MKILSTGKTAWVQKFVCKECEAHLEVSESDLHVGNSAVGYAGETWEPYVFYECAVCHSTNRVTSKIPSGIRDKLFSRAASEY